MSGEQSADRRRHHLERHDVASLARPRLCSRRCSALERAALAEIGEWGGCPGGSEPRAAHVGQAGERNESGPRHVEPATLPAFGGSYRSDDLCATAACEPRPYRAIGRGMHHSGPPPATRRSRRSAHHGYRTNRAALAQRPRPTGAWTTRPESPSHAFSGTRSRTSTVSTSSVSYLRFDDTLAVRDRRVLDRASTAAVSRTALPAPAACDVRSFHRSP